jgi:hypothetical protein
MGAQRRLSHMSAEKELERLEREIADTSTQAPLSSRTLFLPAGKQAKPWNSFDLILVLADSLAVVGIGVNTVRQMPDQQAKSLRDGLLGDAAGLLVGYPLGSFRP